MSIMLHQYHPPSPRWLAYALDCEDILLESYLLLCATLLYNAIDGDTTNCFDREEKPRRPRSDHLLSTAGLVVDFCNLTFPTYQRNIYTYTYLAHRTT